MNTGWMRTDLAVETGILNTTDELDIEGVKIERHQYTEYQIQVSKIVIINEKGEKTVGKKKGTYITIETGWLKENHLDAHQEIQKLLVQQIRILMGECQNKNVLIVGLGNRRVTADALGSMVVDRILVSRHLKEWVPDDLKGRLATVCAITPGVMGQTGIETHDTIKGVIHEIQPDILIVIDALATAGLDRLNGAIQLTDTGISPGAGMGNNRQVLSQETMGIPVIAIGVPTVIDAATLVYTTMEKTETVEPETEKRLMQLTESYYVTPKDMDVAVIRIANMIANALNQSLHDLSREEIQEYLY